MKEKIKKYYKDIICILLFPTVMIFLIGPLEIYSGNISEFEFGINDFIYLFICICCIIVLVGSFIIVLLPQKIIHILEILIFSFSIAAYIQNNFLNNGIYNNNGIGVIWNELKIPMFLNGIVWISIIFTVIVVIYGLKGKSMKVVVLGSLLFGIIQIISSVTIFLSTPINGTAGDKYMISSEGQYLVAPNKNIIILVLDSYSNGTFEYFVDSNPHAAELLKDFTYYSDASSDYRTTFPSIIHMLTGVEVNEDIKTVEEWKEYAWNRDECISFYRKLKDNGYISNIFLDKYNYSIIGANKNLVGKFDNVVESKRKNIDSGLCIRLLTKMSLYKFVPFVLKPKCEVMTYSFRDVIIVESDNTDGEIPSANYEFYKKLVDQRIKIDNDIDNKFTFILLDGIHAPFVNDMNCNEVKSEETNLIDVEKGIFVMLDEYISQLKKLGVYDNATIIICADHGGAEPMFIMKMEDEQHSQMKINKAPICYSDIRPTIMEIVGEDYEEYGCSIHSISDDEIRRRLLYSKDEKGYYEKYEFFDRKELESKFEKEYERIYIME